MDGRTPRELKSSTRSFFDRSISLLSFLPFSFPSIDPPKLASVVPRRTRCANRQCATMQDISFTGSASCSKYFLNSCSDQRGVGGWNNCDRDNNGICLNVLVRSFSCLLCRRKLTMPRARMTFPLTWPPCIYLPREDPTSRMVLFPNDFNRF